MLYASHGRGRVAFLGKGEEMVGSGVVYRICGSIDGYKYSTSYCGDIEAKGLKVGFRWAFGHCIDLS
jgi:hypothetical protein